MKKVLFTATVDSHILQFHLPYLKWFKEQGYEVHVATNGYEKIPFCDEKHNISFERNPIKMNNLKAIKELRRIINKEKFEIIHCHTPMGSVVTRLAAQKARKKGTKVIYTAHGFHFFKGAPILNWIIFYPIEKWLSKYTDYLITINQEDNELARKKFKAKKVIYVPGVGIQQDKFQFEMSEQEKQKLRKNLGIEQNDFVIIYVAELTKRKNQGLLIHVAKDLIDKGHKIKVLLPGFDSMNGYYQKMCKELKIEENVKFLGYRKDIPRLLKISNLYVSTAKQEGLPVNVMEAMACELPIVVTDCRGNRDLIKNNKNGFVIYEIENKMELENKIIAFLNNEKLCRKFKNSNKKIIKKLTVEKIMKEMSKIYK